MKKLMLWIAASAAFSGNALSAQSLTGTWQGAVQSDGKDLRIVVKISTTDQDALKAIVYRIDQGSRPWAASSVVQQGSTVRFVVPGIDGAYEGKLSANGNLIAGTWTVASAAMPLNLTRATVETAWPIPEPPTPLKRMSADADPVFEVASIKPSKPDERRSALVRGRQLAMTYCSLLDVVMFGFDLHPSQVVGGPSWLDTEKYDIVAEPEGEGAPSLQQWRAMLQKLLADRFRFTFHRDRKDLSAYAIVIAKNGPKLAKSGGDPNGLPGFSGPRGKWVARNTTMAELAAFFGILFLDRPMVDHTGLSGRYDLTLEWTPDQPQLAGAGATAGVTVPPAPADDLSAPPDLFTAFQQQLGLKLEAVKAPVSVIVIDRVEKPSAN